MRSSTIIGLTAAVAMAAGSTVAAAAPVRAGAALPAVSVADAGAARRAATPVDDQSALVGFPILAFVGLFTGIALIVVLASGGGGRSPG